ncbi:DUF5412 domain-containing protein [Bacillus haikouensis]|nr:DUF5412 domain-containing protein [Bacillus haikouensis]NQD67479.1 DUF5412 domain-containing protein [Bacillus haikouensis]
MTIFLIVGAIVAAVIGYGVYWLMYDLDRLPQGEFLKEETSPDGTYTLKTYVTNGGATVSYAVRGELVFNDKDGKSETIYWNYREDTANITWTDDDTVIINGQRLDVPGDTYDFRHQ